MIVELLTHRTPFGVSKRPSLHVSKFHTTAHLLFLHNQGDQEMKHIQHYKFI